MNQIYDFVGLPSFELPKFGRVINENPLELPPPDSQSMAKLRAFFRPRNEKLWDVIGKKFDW